MAANDTRGTRGRPPGRGTAPPKSKPGPGKATRSAVPAGKATPRPARAAKPDRSARPPSRTVADFGAITFTPLTETVARGVEYFRQHGVLGEYTHLQTKK